MHAVTDTNKHICLLIPAEVLLSNLPLFFWPLVVFDLPPTHVSFAPETPCCAVPLLCWPSQCHSVLSSLLGL